MTIQDIEPDAPPAEALTLAETTIGTSPIFTHRWPDADGFNARLRQVILDRKDIDPGLKKSNCGGWQSQRNLQLWGDPAITELLERLHTMLREVIHHTVPDPDESLVTGWDVEA